ncbi:MAG TPA: MSHA biogenesis protein MshI [Burkholderiales bacterium]|nr:MSHA biogenesis protein MshI [Burkholderiales bacterium]
MSQQINLFSPIFLKQKKYFSAMTMLQALGLILLGSLLFYGYLLFETRSLSTQAADTEKQSVNEQARLTKFSSEFSPAQKSAALDEQIKKLEAQVQSRQEVVAAIKNGVIGNTDGYSEYMRAIARQSIQGWWLTGFSISGAGNEMVLKGGVLRPELVPLYVQRLNREPVMKGRQFAFLQINRPQQKSGTKPVARAGYLEFNLQSVEPEKTK